MINRYSKSDFKELWSDYSRFSAMLKVEVYNCEALHNKGIIPQEDLNSIIKNANFDIDRIEEIEKDTGHDVVAFVKSINEFLGDEKRWIHYGLTSTDVMDTAYGHMYLNANNVLEDKINEFIDVLKNKAIEYKYVPCIGRTHGIHAEITSFGLKWLLWYEDFKRVLKQFKEARKLVECGKISGAVGNHANVDPYIQDYVCNKLGIDSAKVSTQVLQRDRHASYLNSIALIASLIEKIATEIRGLQRTELSEVREPFGKKQKGSSAMPHKKNPIVSENMTGIARVIRGYATTAMNDIALWHERDISHSSVERIIVPDATILLEYMLTRYKNILENLVIYEERMIENINHTNGVVYSQRVLNSLISKGFDRITAYDKIQKLAYQAYENRIEFRKLISEDMDIMQVLNNQDLDQCFDYNFYLRKVDEIFKRVGI